MPLPDFNALGIVYAIFFMVAGTQHVAGHYVGMTHRSIAERFEEHVRKASDVRKGTFTPEGKHTKLYAKMAALGIGSCYVVPLQVVDMVPPAENEQFYAAAKRVERDWVRILDSRDSGFNTNIPGGATTRFSSFLDSFTGNVQSLWHPIRALYRRCFGNVGDVAYHYRDYVRRFQALHARKDFGGSQGQLAVMATMRRQNLERMAAVASLHNVPGISPEDQGTLVGMIVTHLEARIQNHHRRGKRAIKMFVPSFVSVLMDDLPLAQILANAESASLLPPQMRHVHVMLGFRYSCPIGRKWCNYREFFTSHSTSELQGIADGPCDCHLPEYDRFKLPGCSHVTTCSSDFLRMRYPHLPNLAAIWERGSKYRPHTHDIDSPAHRELLFNNLQYTMNQFKGRMARKFDIQEDLLTPWCSDILSKLQTSMQLLGDPSFAQLGPQHAPSYGRAERAAMDELLGQYICTSVDKLSNTMFLACKCIMAQAELTEINSAVLDQDPTYVRVEQSIGDIFGAAASIVEEAGLEPGEQTLPFLHPIPKLHKPQLAFRFITVCSKFHLSEMAVWVTRLMRAIEPDLTALWGTLDFPASFKFGRYPPWMMHNSTQLVRLTRTFNMFQDLQTHDASAPRLRSYDFEQLFTKLDQEDLKSKLGGLIDTAFDTHTGYFLRVRKGMSAKWEAGPLPNVRASYDEGAKSYVFDKASAKHLVNFIIDNAFLQVGDEIFRQVKGIPMGVSPAMYFANYYLFAYEFIFLRDAIQTFRSTPARSQRSHVKDAILTFQFVSRYADDEVIINRPFSSQPELLFYNNQRHANIHGIYPTCLKLKASASEPFRVLHALDVTIKPAHESSGPLITHLYDKRRDAQFQGVTSFMRFPAADSMLAWSCKLNVFNAQFTRFSRIISDATNFKFEVVRLLAEMIDAKYPAQPLLQRCRRCCNRIPVLFGVARGTQASTMGRPVHGMFTDIRKEVMSRLNTDMPDI